MTLLAINMYRLLIILFLVSTAGATLPETITDAGTKEAADYLDMKISYINGRIDSATGALIGPQGPAGSQGPPGATGATGATGAKGDKGDDGASGYDNFGNHIATMTITAGYGISVSTIVASSSITASAFIGDGSNLTNLPSTKAYFGTMTFNHIEVYDAIY